MTVNYAQQIIDGIRGSALDRILVIDDAYDQPELAQAGALLDVLAGHELRAHVNEEALSEEVRQEAIDALAQHDFDAVAVEKAISSLYTTYVEHRATAIDPAGLFEAVKGAALDALDPLVELLERCGDECRVQRVGKDNALPTCKEMDPHLILMDFFLSPPDRPERVTRGEADADRQRSITLLKKILEVNPEMTPAVILMSTQNLANRADAYRARLEGKVTALHFGFLNKDWIEGTGDHLRASGDAADVLMDTSGCFEFGRTLEAALMRWRSGAIQGLDRLHAELRDFDVKDFAYLLRFRLYDEGEPFADYLEWFLGESLRAIVDDEVTWNAEDFTRLNDEQLTADIEGAHQLPSDRIAKFFHRMRFGPRKNRTRKRFALGDLFISSNNHNVRMVITPDCDLVPRKKGPAATRVLTVGGVIGGLEEDKVFAGELFFHKTPKAIKWNYKDVMTHDIGDLERLRVNGSEYSYFGSMRAMSGQAIQKTVLADLSRVGLAVPPIVAVGAPVTVYMKKNVRNQASITKIEGLTERRAQVFMPRGGREERMRVLFTKKFFRELVAIIEGTDEGQLSPDHQKHRKGWLRGRAKVRRAMVKDRLELPGNHLHKTRLTVGQPTGNYWLEIVVDVSEGALSYWPATDPLLHS